jgi:hypothetical protein
MPKKDALKGKKVRYKSLNKAYNTKVRREILDADYLSKLSKKDYRWYAQFTDEYAGGSVKKNADGSIQKGHIHNTPELAKKCYDDNNRRNVDLYGVTKANNLMHSIDPGFNGSETKLNSSHSPSNVGNEYTHYSNLELTELAVISEIDNQENEEELTFKEYIMARKQMVPEAREYYDLKFLEQYPNAFLYYTIYDSRNLTEKQIDRLIRKPKLLEKLFKNPQFMQRKKKSPNSTQS